MARVALLLGGNQGDVKRTLQTAQQLINSRVGAVLRCSHRYESEAWGFRSADRFSNQALEVSTDLTPHEVLDVCQGIERELGRNRAAEAMNEIMRQRRHPVTGRTVGEMLEALRGEQTER